MTQPVIVVGAGIVGLAVARRLVRDGHDVVVIDKEPEIARHQTSHNSGVVHSGIYYAPGSLKARTATTGAASMIGFARDCGVDVDVCGKLVVATNPAARARLHAIADRAHANGVAAALIGPREARDHEPHVSCVEALWVPGTAIVDFVGVSRALAGDVAGGGEIRLGERVVAIREEGTAVVVETSLGEVRGSAVVNCAGLYADRVAALAGVDADVQIVPFRGEYFDLSPDRAAWVNGLIYPVPDPSFPFLGVHLTRSIHGGVHAGPNAVLALAREGYRWRDVNRAELRESLVWPGLRGLASKHAVAGAREVARSASKRAFARSVSRLVPGITAGDLQRSEAGVRAQAVRRDGSLVDDFLIESCPRQVHVLNAPSPAATASLAIAEHVVSELNAVLP